MFDPTKTIESIQAEIDRTIKELAKAKGIDDKLKWSELLNNLTDSIGVYFDFVIDSMAADMDMWDEEDEEERD
jgi:uncharacterized phage protein gp47/JayE